MTKMKNRGFTLIELLIVIAIIAILAGIIVATLGNPTGEARNSTRVNELDSIADACQQYLIDNASYPATLGVLVTDGLITALPVDPQTGNGYSYVRCLVNGNPRIVIGANLENAGGAVDKAADDIGASPWACDAVDVCVGEVPPNPNICPAALDLDVECGLADGSDLIYCVSR